MAQLALAAIWVLVHKAQAAEMSDNGSCIDGLEGKNGACQNISNVSPGWRSLLPFAICALIFAFTALMLLYQPSKPHTSSNTTLSRASQSVAWSRAPSPEAQSGSSRQPASTRQRLSSCGVAPTSAPCQRSSLCGAAFDAAVKQTAAAPMVEHAEAWAVDARHMDPGASAEQQRASASAEHQLATAFPEQHVVTASAGQQLVSAATAEPKMVPAPAVRQDDHAPQIWSGVPTLPTWEGNPTPCSWPIPIPPARQSHVNDLPARQSHVSIGGSRPQQEEAYEEGVRMSCEEGVRMSPGMRVKVVSVDDEHVNHVVLRALLRGDKATTYDLIELDSGEELLEYMSSEAQDTPDVILLDVAMTGISGYEAASHLRQTWTAAQLPIIMLTGSSSEEAVIDGLNAGASDYMVKPLRGAELKARINTQVALKRSVRVAMEAARNLELLKGILPPEIIKHLKQGHHAVAQYHGQVTVLFSDIKSFTNMASSWPTEKIICLLNVLFSRFDELCEQLGVYKVETIGDAYMIVSGHAPGEEDHALRMMRMASAIVEAVEDMGHEWSFEGQPLQIRVGVHTGPAHSGVVGTIRPRYCFFGDTVNVASRMEATSFPMAVQVSAATRTLVEEQLFYGETPFSEYEDPMFVACGPRLIKGKGVMHTHLLKVGLWEEALADLATGNLDPVDPSPSATPTWAMLSDMFADPLDSIGSHGASYQPARQQLSRELSSGTYHVVGSDLLSWPSACLDPIMHSLPSPGLSAAMPTATSGGARRLLKNLPSVTFEPSSGRSNALDYSRPGLRRSMTLQRTGSTNSPRTPYAAKRNSMSNDFSRSSALDSSPAGGPAGGMTVPRTLTTQASSASSRGESYAQVMLYSTYERLEFPMSPDDGQHGHNRHLLESGTDLLHLCNDLIRHECR